MSSNILLISVQQIKDRTGLHQNVDEKLLKPDIKFCQDSFIHPILGTALMEKIQTDLLTLSGKYKELYDDYLVDALCYYTISESPSTLSYQLYNKGVIRKTSDDTQLPDNSELLKLSDKYKSRAEYYGNRMAQFLIQNHADFPEYDSPGDGIDTIHPDKKPFKTSFFLENEKCNGGWDWIPTSDSNFKNGCK